MVHVVIKQYILLSSAVDICHANKTVEKCIYLFLPHRCCLATTVKGDLIPGSNKDPGGSEGYHTLEILSDILSGPLQDLWV